MLTLGSLFDGIGGWCLAAQHSGIKPIWSSEIEKFPMAVTAYHFPEVRQMGDITLLDGATLPPVDIICAGSPCQDLSIAYGRGRKGLDGERSGLFTDAVRIIRQMRNATGGIYPKYFVWENVPGTLSANENMAFCTVLESLTGCKIPVPRSGKWAAAGMVRSRQCNVGWRILNSKFFGVPQFRQRIFLVADFRAGQRSTAEILFECKNVQGVINEGGRDWDKNAGTLEDCTGEAGESVNNDVYDISYRMDVIRKYSGCVPTLGARMGTGGNNVPIVLSKPEKNASIITYNVVNSVAVRKHEIDTSGIKKLLRDALKKSKLSKKQIAEALNVPQTEAEHWFRADTYFSVPDAKIWFELKELLGIETDKYDAQVTEFVVKDCTFDMQNRIYDSMGVSPTITNALAKKTTIVNAKTVRRLTPREVERLQGLPDNWTCLPGNKLCSDSARYKAIGNGMAQPCADWILKRIAEVEREDKNE